MGSITEECQQKIHALLGELFSKHHISHVIIRYRTSAYDIVSLHTISYIKLRYRILTYDIVYSISYTLSHTMSHTMSHTINDILVLVQVACSNSKKIRATLPLITV